MNKQLIKGYVDNDVFRHMLLSKDETSNKLLISFCCLFTKRKIVEVNIAETEPPKDIHYQKGIRFDISVTCFDEMENEVIVNIEMQNGGNADILAKRILSYTSKLISNQMKKGDDEYQIHDVYQITILNNLNMFDDEEYFHVFPIYDPLTRKEFRAQQLHIVILELDKLCVLNVDKICEWNELEKVGYLLKYALVENKRDIIKLLINQSEVLRMEYYKDYFEDFAEYKKIWENYELEHWDELVKEQAIYDRNQEIISNMYTLGLSLEQISLYSGLPMREVKRILNT